MFLLYTLSKGFELFDSFLITLRLKLKHISIYKNVFLYYYFISLTISHGFIYFNHLFLIPIIILFFHYFYNFKISRDVFKRVSASVCVRMQVCVCVHVC